MKVQGLRLTVMEPLAWHIEQLQHILNEELRAEASALSTLPPSLPEDDCVSVRCLVRRWCRAVPGRVWAERFATGRWILREDNCSPTLIWIRIVPPHVWRCEVCQPTRRLTRMSTLANRDHTDATSIVVSAGSGACLGTRSRQFDRCNTLPSTTRVATIRIVVPAACRRRGWG